MIGWWALTAAGDAATGQGAELGAGGREALRLALHGCVRLSEAGRSGKRLRLAVSASASRTGSSVFGKAVAYGTWQEGFLTLNPWLLQATSWPRSRCSSQGLAVHPLALRGSSELPVVCLPGTSLRGAREARAGCPGLQEPQQSVSETEEPPFSDRQTEAQSGEGTSQGRVSLHNAGQSSAAQTPALTSRPRFVRDEPQARRARHRTCGVSPGLPGTPSFSSPSLTGLLSRLTAWSFV